jgi:peptidoglycan/LPS O-acetylase OafA/YrhL
MVIIKLLAANTVAAVRSVRSILAISVGLLLLCFAAYTVTKAPNYHPSIVMYVMAFLVIVLALMSFQMAINVVRNIKADSHKQAKR